jgi:hypothetical protein
MEVKTGRRKLFHPEGKVVKLNVSKKEFKTKEKYSAQNLKKHKSLLFVG